VGVASAVLTTYGAIFAAVPTALISCAASGADCSAIGTAMAMALPFSGKISRQMVSRGWTAQAVQEAIAKGRQFPAINKATGNSAIRYVHPRTGQSVVVDSVTKEVIHVGGPGFRY
jgi:hypothetical protein